MDNHTRFLPMLKSLRYHPRVPRGIAFSRISPCICVCVCLFFFCFHKVASLLGLCLFWQPATWFIYVQLLHYIALRVVANKVPSLSLCNALTFESVYIESWFLVNRHIFRIFRLSSYIEVSGTRSRLKERKSVRCWPAFNEKFDRGRGAYM